MLKLIKKLKSKGKKGFTLVESVVSIGILAIVSLTFATFLATSTRMTMLTVQNERDYALLQEAVATKDFTELVKDGIKIVGIEETGKEFVIEFKNAEDIVVKGKYLIVANPKTRQHFAIFIGDSNSVNTENSTT